MHTIHYGIVTMGPAGFCNLTCMHMLNMFCMLQPMF